MTDKYQQSGNPQSILIVDDDEVVVKTLRIQLEDQRWEVHTAQTSEEAQSICRDCPTAVALVAVDVSGMDCIELVRALRQQAPEIIVILMTGYPTLSMAVKELKNPACEYLVKPFRIEQLLMGIERARRELALIRENRELKLKIVELQAAIQQSTKTAETVDKEKEVSEQEELAAQTTPYIQYKGKIPGGDSGAIASYERQSRPIQPESLDEEQAVSQDSTEQEGEPPSPSE